MQTMSALEIKTTINYDNKESLMKNGVGILTASNMLYCFPNCITRSNRVVKQILMRFRLSELGFNRDNIMNFQKPLHSYPVISLAKFCLS